MDVDRRRCAWRCLIPVSAGTMAGTSRYALMAIPAFWVLALWARREGVFVAMVAVSAGLLALERRVAADALAVTAAGHEPEAVR